MIAENSSAPILELNGVTKKFGQEPGVLTKFFKKWDKSHKNEYVYAVNNISIQVAKNEVVGLVGESGCGKSTLARLAVGLLSPDSGKRIWRGDDFDEMTAQEQFKLRL